MSLSSSLLPKEPVVTAEKYIAYKKKNGHIVDFIAPKSVLVCYQQSTLLYFLKTQSTIQQSKSFPNLYLVGDGSVGILGGWGMGAPALSVKMEELIALGVKEFIAVGTAGTLMHKHGIGDFIVAPKALGEDGVAHLYLDGKTSAAADEELLSLWHAFTKRKDIQNFHSASSWSFPALFKETPSDIARVTSLGYDVVEMEAATLYAIGEEKGVKTLSLFVISDTMSLDEWVPHIKEPIVKDNLHTLADLALQFCKENR